MTAVTGTALAVLGARPCSFANRHNPSGKLVPDYGSFLSLPSPTASGEKRPKGSADNGLGMEAGPVALTDRNNGTPREVRGWLAARRRKKPSLNRQLGMHAGHG